MVLFDAGLGSCLLLSRSLSHEDNQLLVHILEHGYIFVEHGNHQPIDQVFQNSSAILVKACVLRTIVLLVVVAPPATNNTAVVLVVLSCTQNEE